MCTYKYLHLYPSSCPSWRSSLSLSRADGELAKSVFPCWILATFLSLPRWYLELACSAFRPVLDHSIAPLHGYHIHTPQKVQWGVQQFHQTSVHALIQKASFFCASRYAKQILKPLSPHANVYFQPYAVTIPVTMSEPQAESIDQ